MGCSFEKWGRDGVGVGTRRRSRRVCCQPVEEIEQGGWEGVRDSLHWLLV